MDCQWCGLPFYDEGHTPIVCIEKQAEVIATITAERDAGAKMLARQCDMAREAETRVSEITRERDALTAQVEELREELAQARNAAANAH